MSTSRSRRERETAKQEAKEKLLQILRPGDRVYGIVRTVSRSGMSRTIDFYAFGPQVWSARHKAGCDRIYLSGYIADLLDYRRTDSGALKVQGCGMDMIFSVVYSVGHALWPEGFGLPCEHCGYRSQSKDDAQEKYAAASDKEAGAGSRFSPPYCPCEADSNPVGWHSFWGRNADRSGWDEDGGYALKAEQL